MKEQTLIYRNRKINYYFQGDVSKKTIVFIHGNSLSSKTFSEQFNGIKDITLLAIDLPGHGLSEPPAEPEKVYSILGYIDIVKFVIAELKISNYILAGHSLGGHIALEASNELNGLKGLILFGTPPLGIPPEMDKAFLPNAAMAFLFQEQLTEIEIELLSAALTDNINKEKLKNEIRISDGKARSFLAASIPKGLFKNEIKIIENLNIPIAILHGEADSLISKQYIDGLTIPTLWKNEIQLIKNTCHCPQVERPGAFNAIISSFYNSIL